MQDLKDEEQELRDRQEYTQADMCAARYQELRMLFNELKASI